MAQEYYSLERAAEILRLSTGEVNRMREQSQLRAFRDGSNWKFRKEDVEEALVGLIKMRSQQEEAEEESVAFGLTEDSEVPTLMAETDPSNTNDGLTLSDEDSNLGLALVLDETISQDTPQTERIDLAKPESHMEDDELVLGGGSDLNLSGGSGLSLIEESGNEAVLELDEDSSVLAMENSEDRSTTTVFAETDEIGTFDLVADANADEDSESSSQVIALDDEAPFGEMPDFSSADSFGSAIDSDAFGPAAGAGNFGSAAMPTPKPAAFGRSPYEATYSGKAVTALALACVIPVGLAGMLVCDLVRYMWSWDQASAVLSSPIVDAIAGALGW
ncbi:MAG: helix-turn-helix domain-containing protein [Planctomycetaceae bacterium]|nr:helix-turn-helix domain-containing protein [Planctomycetaceae bacterium]